jgi:hypothetical protein
VKDILKIRVEADETETRKARGKINETESLNCSSL